MKRETVLKVLYITLILSVMAVWGQSCLNKEDSTENSDMVLNMVTSVDDIKNGPAEEAWKYDYYNAIVRKIAHVVEYSALGFQMICILYLLKKRKIKHYIGCLYGGLTIAFIDESIQILSSRGPLISDMWIDLGGITVGMILGTAFSLLVIKIYKKKQMKQIEE